MSRSDKKPILVALREFFAFLLTFYFVTFNGYANTIGESKGIDRQVYEKAIHALIQGDRKLAEKIIEDNYMAQPQVFSELEIILLLEQGEIDTVIDKLEQYESDYAELAKTFSFTAKVWRSVGHKVSVFRKRAFYKRALKAKVRAGNLEPENPYFLTLKASAVGHDDGLASLGETQLTVTNKIISLDKKWGLIAQINYAQNTDDIATGKALAQRAAAELPQDFDIHERVAQYYWTIGIREKAQQHFLIACRHPPEDSWHNKIAWSDACYQVAQFAHRYSMRNDLGVDALNILLSRYNLPTRTNLDLVVMLSKLTNSALPDSAVTILHHIAASSENKKMLEVANNLLKVH